MSTSAPDFELENVAAGPNVFAFSEAASDPDTDTIVLLFQRDYHCRNCRQQVQDIAERYGDFEEVNASVVAILPEPADRAAEWHRQYDLPFPLLADPSKAVSETYDQPTRFGALGSLHDLIGRMPLAVVFDVTGSEPTVMNTYEGKTPSDRPSIDDLLADVGTLGTA
jgi:peroxiredoxin Q/BCP